MKIAIISDIHGNSWALESIFQDIGFRSPDLIINLGDSLYGPLDPIGTFELISSKKIISISGNEDRLIIENINNKTTNETLHYVIHQLNNDSLAWLKSLHTSEILDNRIYLCHGTPFSDEEYLLEDLNDNQIGIKSKETLEILLHGIDQKIILCGHSHTPGLMNTQKHLIINPGSVGLQAYVDDFPIKHKIENHVPFAQYCIVELTINHVKVERVAISYDFEKAAHCAESNNRTDWAKWIRTGQV